MGYSKWTRSSNTGGHDARRSNSQSSFARSRWPPSSAGRYRGKPRPRTAIEAAAARGSRKEHRARSQKGRRSRRCRIGHPSRERSRGLAIRIFALTDNAIARAEVGQLSRLGQLAQPTRLWMFERRERFTCAANNGEDAALEALDSGAQSSRGGWEVRVTRPD